MDFSKLTLGDKVLAGSGIALFIFSFFTWFKIDTPFGDYSETAWDYFFTGIVPVLLGLALVAYVVVTKLLDGVETPHAPRPVPAGHPGHRRARRPAGPHPPAHRR